MCIFQVHEYWISEYGDIATYYMQVIEFNNLIITIKINALYTIASNSF